MNWLSWPAIINYTPIRPSVVDCPLPSAFICLGTAPGEFGVAVIMLLGLDTRITRRKRMHILSGSGQEISIETTQQSTKCRKRKSGTGVCIQNKLQRAQVTGVDVGEQQRHVEGGGGICRGKKAKIGRQRENAGNTGVATINVSIAFLLSNHTFFGTNRATRAAESTLWRHSQISDLRSGAQAYQN